ncbi:hypothetical protein HYU13_02565 [Candidatus Woesearchaeota archaeon]|nr:hypothetical protein [Candidatus Woesearchaeota archaeon]
MDKNVKKVIYAAIGAASIAAEKAEKIARQIAKQGVVSHKEAMGMVKELTSEANKQRKRLQGIVVRQLAKAGSKAEKRGKKIVGKAARMAEKKGKKILRRFR